MSSNQDKRLSTTSYRMSNGDSDCDSSDDGLFHDSDSDNEDEKPHVSWYKKLAPAKENAKKQGHVQLIKRGKYEFGSVEDQDAFVDHIQATNPEDRIFHELLPDKGCRMFADIDADGIPMEKAIVFLQFNELMADVFDKVPGLPKFKKKNVRIAISTGKKTSAHWSYMGPSFRTQKEQKAFWQFVSVELRENYPDLYFGVNDDHTQINTQSVIDLGVYKHGPLRAVLCHKDGEDRVLIPSKLDEKRKREKALKNYNIADYLIWNPDADEWYDLTLPEKKYKAVKIDCDIEQIIESELPDMKVAEVCGAMIKLRNVGGGNNRVCIIGGEENKSDHGYVVIKRDGLYFRCHDEECEGQEKKIHSFASEHAEKYQVFRDYTKFVGKRCELAEIQAWVDKTVVLIDNGGDNFLLTRGEYKYPIDPSTGHPKYPSFFYWKTVRSKDVMDTLRKKTNVINNQYDAEYAEEFEEMSKKDQKVALRNVSNRMKIKPALYDSIGPSLSLDGSGFLADCLLSNNLPNFDKVSFVPYLARNGKAVLYDAFNTFTGFPMDSIPLQINDSFENSLWYKHIGDELMNGDAAETNHFWDFLADVIQDPATIKGISHLFYSEQGMGKSLMGDWLKRLIGDNLVYSFSNVADYFEGFNSAHHSKLIKIFEEVSDRGDAFYKHDILKARQTAPEEVVKIKYMNDYTVPNYARHIYFTNNRDCLYIENSDRRHTLHKANNRYANKTEYFGKIVAELTNPQFVRAAFEFFATRVYEKKSVYTAHESQYKVEQKQKNLPQGIKYIVELIEENLNEITHQGDKVHAKVLSDGFVEWCKKNGGKGTAAGFKTAIGKLDIGKPKPMRVNGKMARGYHLNADVWEKRLQRFLKLPSFKFDIIEPDSDEDSE